jgi:hypothetical protein
MYIERRLARQKTRLERQVSACCLSMASVRSYAQRLDVMLGMGAGSRLHTGLAINPNDEKR